MDSAGATEVFKITNTCLTHCYNTQTDVFRTGLYSVGTQDGNLHQSAVWTSRVTYFIPPGKHAKAALAGLKRKEKKKEKKKKRKKRERKKRGFGKMKVN